MENNNKIKWVMASRMNRLGAFLLDSLTSIFLLIFIYILMGWWDPLIKGEKIESAQLIFSFCLQFFIWLIINRRLLEKRGQTLGKYLFGIKIIDMRTMKTPTLHILIIKRFLLFQVLNSIPGIGVFFSLADLLPIFSKNRLCLHDMYAGTIVVKVP